MALDEVKSSGMKWNEVLPVVRAGRQTGIGSGAAEVAGIGARGRQNGIAEAPRFMERIRRMLLL